MPLVTRTIVVYIDDELVEVDIDVEEEDNVKRCKLCEKAELFQDNDIICSECWACCVLVPDHLVSEVSDKEDDNMSYRSFKEIVRQRNQSEVSEVSEVSEISAVSNEKEDIIDVKGAVESWDRVLDYLIGMEVPDCEKCSKSCKSIEYYCEMVKKGDGFKGDIYSFLQVCQECKEELKEKWHKGSDKRYALREKERLDYINRHYEYNPVSNKGIEKIEEKEWVCEHCQVEGTYSYYLELCQDCCRKLHPDYDKKEYPEMLGYLYSMLGSQCERIEVLHELNARFVSDVALNVFEKGTAWSGEMMRAIAKLIQKAQIIK
jgi:hypothetical protein